MHLILLILTICLHNIWSCRQINIFNWQLNDLKFLILFNTFFQLVVLIAIYFFLLLMISFRSALYLMNLMRTGCFIVGSKIRILNFDVILTSHCIRALFILHALHYSLCLESKLKVLISCSHCQDTQLLMLLHCIISEEVLVAIFAEISPI